jgi:hypothetical protein
VARMRVGLRGAVLQVTRCAFRPTVPAWELCEWLGVRMADRDERRACEGLIGALGLRLVDSRGEVVEHLGSGVLLDCRASGKVR